MEGMRGTFGVLLIGGGVTLIVLVLKDLVATVPAGAANSLGQFNPAGAAQSLPPGSSVGLPVNGKCPDGTVNLGGVCTVNPLGILSPGQLPPTAAPGSGRSTGTPGGCPAGYHSALIGGRYPVCVKD